VISFAGLVAVVQRRQDADHQMDPGVLVGRRDAEHHRWVIAPAGQPHGAGEGLGQVILAGPFHVGPVLPVTGGGGVNDPRVAPLQIFVAQPQAVHDAGPEILDHHVSLFRQRQHTVADGLVAQVHRHAALVAVEGQEGVDLAVGA
jgi:hypothetical protein